MVERGVPSKRKICDVDLLSYLAAVKEALADEVEKYNEFSKILHDVKAHRMDEANGIPRMAELIKGNRTLLLGLSFFYPEVNLTIPPEADQLRVAKKKHAEKNFMNKLKIRFKKVDARVVESYLGLMKMLKEGKKPAKKVYDEVIHLIYYHEDLREEFSAFFLH